MTDPGPKHTCGFHKTPTPDAWRVNGVPAAMCPCDVRAWMDAQQRAGLETADGLEDEDRVQALRAMGEPLVYGPKGWREVSPGVIAVDFGSWACSWAFRALGAWDEAGLPLYVQGRPHPRLVVAFVRARFDPEWREGGESVRRIGGRSAWGRYLSLAGWPPGAITEARRCWRPPHNPGAP